MQQGWITAQIHLSDQQISIFADLRDEEGILSQEEIDLLLQGLTQFSRGKMIASLQGHFLLVSSVLEQSEVLEEEV